MILWAFFLPVICYPQPYPQSEQKNLAYPPFFNHGQRCKTALLPRRARDDDQIKILVLSLNNSRRHLTAGQKVMAVAIAYPDAAKFNGNRFSSGSNLVPLENVHKGRLASARKILRFTPSQVPKVMSGNLPFSTAVAEAQKIGEKFRTSP